MIAPRARRVLHSTLLLAAALTAYTCLIVALHHRPPPPGTQALTTADTGAYGAVALPHDWRKLADRPAQVRYELGFDHAAASKGPTGLYLSSVHHTLVLWLNGERVADTGSLGPPMARNHNRPQLIGLPEHLLRPGENRLRIDVHSDPPGSGFLPAPVIGPMAGLEPHYAQRYWLRVGAMNVITIATLALCGVMLTLWYFRREETMYLWFSITAGLWLLYLLNYQVVAPPFDAQAWVVLVRFAALGWFVLGIVIFINRFLGAPQPRYERTLAVMYTLLPAALLLPDFATASHWGLRAFTPLVWLLGLDPAIKMTRAVWGRSDQEIIWLTYSGLAILVLGVHDILLNSGLISREHGHYLIYAPPVTVMVFTWMLVRRFVRALHASEVLNRELEQRVAEKVDEARRAYDRLGAVERESALRSERERIMRDMHDGVGGHLVSTLYLVQRGQYSAEEVRLALKQALDDLRLMIDSMESPEGELPLALANMRARLTPQLAKAGIQLQWNVDDAVESVTLGPAHTLQVMRIVQEAITNAVKHSGATHIALGCTRRPGGIRVEVRDDGRGLPPDAPPAPSGRGLSNMRHRAVQIGAELEVQPAHPGVAVVLEMPTGA